MYTAVFFELSNQCNLAQSHKKCPASLVTEPVVLPTEVIERTLQELSEMDFQGEICWHRYNEPLIDERLPMLIGMARRIFPTNKIRVLTNGHLLNDQMRELFDRYNVSVLVSKPGLLDDRLTLYGNEVLEQGRPCWGMEELTITCHGDVGMCCMDWKNMQTFGSLKEKSLREVMADERYKEARKNLRAGQRVLEPCMRCTWNRKS